MTLAWVCIRSGIVGVALGLTLGFEAQRGRQQKIDAVPMLN
jgi:hypothetical protein